MQSYKLGGQKCTALALHDQRNGKTVEPTAIPEASLPLLQQHPYNYTPSVIPPELRGTRNSALKASLLNYLTSHSDGVPVSKAVKAVAPKQSDPDVSERAYTTTDYRRAKRFFNRSEYAELRAELPSPDRERAVLTAYPAPEAFHLIPTKQISNRDRKAVAERYISHIPYLSEKRHAQYITKRYLGYLDSISDKRLMLEDQSGRSQSTDLTMPYHTRFNNEQRKADQWNRYNTAWEKASEKWSKAQFWTLTTDPKRYDSIAGMVEGITKAWRNLLEALNQKFDFDERLDFIRAIEFTGSEKSNYPGMPHLHVVVFGVPYLDKYWVEDYWNKKQDHAKVVDYYSIGSRNGDWIMRKDGSKFSAESYLGKYLSKNFENIGKNLEDMYNVVENWDDKEWKSSPIWKMALYWATGKSFWDSSHGLKETEPDTLSEVGGLGETKESRLSENGINTFSDVRLADTEELAAINGISESFAEKIKEIAGDPSRFDVGNYEFVGAAKPRSMPRYWSESATHIGVSAVG